MGCSSTRILVVTRWALRWSQVLKKRFTPFSSLRFHFSTMQDATQWHVSIHQQRSSRLDAFLAHYSQQYSSVFSFLKHFQRPTCSFKPIQVKEMWKELPHAAHPVLICRIRSEWGVIGGSPRLELLPKVQLHLGSWPWGVWRCSPWSVPHWPWPPPSIFAG